MVKQLLFKKRRFALRCVLICTLCCLSMAVNARTWTIGTGGDFVDFNAAMSSSSVVDGDELKVLPGSVLSGNQMITKSVSIIGNGYDMESGTLSSSAQLQGNLQLMSDGIKVSSFVLNRWAASSPNSYYTSSLYIYASDVIVEKCLIDGYIRSNKYYDTENTIIRQCFISSALMANGASGWTVSNNIIACEYGSTSYSFSILSDLDDSVIDHNIICSLFYNNLDVKTYCINNVTSSTITNNILVHFQSNKQWEGTADGIITEECILNNTVMNNVFTGDAPNSNNRGGIYATTDIFDCGSTSITWSFFRYDTNLKLIPNSPAAGYATDGGDCGPWSGPYPYVIGGITSGTEPMVGNYKLDLNAVDTPSAGVFQSLLSLFTAMATNGIGSQISVSVADGDYDLNLDDSTYPVLQAFGEQVTSSTGTISMAAPTQATFNIKASALFLLGHYTEISAITSIIKERISLTHITVTVNDTPVIYDEFQVEANDLLALKNMYNAWGGTNWTTKKWSFENNGHSKDDFPGVTFDDNGRVTAIDLENNNLVGETFDIYSPQLSEVTSLNLSRNKLTGDISKIVPSMTKLQMLNLSYNRLTELTDPSAIVSSASVNLKSQNRVWKDATDEDKMLFTDNFYSLTPTVIKVSKSQPTISVPTLFTYDWEKLIYLRQLYAPEISYGNVYSYNSLSLDSPYQVYMMAQDTLVAMVFAYGTYKAKYSAYPAILHYEEGDADMTGETNVLDVQYMLNYILAPSTISYFNYSAANTYADQLINVQDIVKTVNIILNQPFYLYSRHKEKLQADMSEEMDNTATPTEGTAYTENGQIKVNAQKDLSAIDIELEGVTVDQVGQMLNQRDFQMIGRNTEWGCRFIIFSPTGKRIAADTVTALLRLSSQATLVGIQCSDPNAQEVLMTVTTTPTGIRETTREKTADDATYDLNGRRLTKDANIMKGIYVRQGQKFIVR